MKNVREHDSFLEEKMELPEEMAVDEVHQLVDEGVILNFETFGDYDDARHFAYYFEQGFSEFETRLYTQVDSDTSDYVVYLKGKHYVNRTGVYLVLWK